MKTKRVGWVIVALAVFAVALTACHSSKANQAYNNSIAKGLDAVAQDKFDNAASYFENALDQKPKDTKAKAYLKQTNGYLNTEKALNDGDPEKAGGIVAKVVAVKHGAKSLTRKLKSLQTTVKADLKEYNSLQSTLVKAKKAAKTSPEKANKVLADVKDTDWDKKPYLKKLKPTYDSLVKSISAAVSKKKVSTNSASTSADHIKANQIRKSLVASFGGSIGLSQLQRLSDAVILAADAQSTGNTQQTGRILLQQHPEISPSAESTDSNSGTTTQQNSHDVAESIRSIMASNQGFDTSVLASIPDSVIIQCTVGTATNAQLAESASNLLARYPSLKK